MKQTRAGSFIEALANIAIGLGVSFFANLLFLPLVGIHATAQQNVILCALFTAISLARSYALRRIFSRMGN